MMPGQMLLLAKIGAVGVLILAVFMSGHHIGARAVQADWDAYKVKAIAAQDKLIAENEEHNAAVQAMHDKYNAQISDQHGKAIAELQNKYDTDIAAVRAAGGLRIPRTVCNAVATGTETASAGRSDATATGTIALPEQITSDLLSLAAEADRTTEIARSCQNWIRLNGFYDAPSSR